MREHLFKELFLSEFYDSVEYREQCERYLADLSDISEEDKAELAAKAEAAAACIPEIDRDINQVSEGWKTTRMGKVELTLLRLAYYEMTRDENVPVRVAINEAVELSKIYGGEESPAFVNAILGKLSRQSAEE